MRIVQVETELLSRDDLCSEAEIVTVLEVIDQGIVVLALKVVARSQRKLIHLAGFTSSASPHVIDLVRRFTGVGVAGCVRIGGLPIHRVQIDVKPESVRRRHHCPEQQTVLVPGEIVAGINDIAVVEAPAG